MDEKLSRTYEEFLTLTREIHYLTSTGGILDWDQQVMMPPKAAPLRASQMATLTGVVHDRVTSPRLSELIERLEGARDSLDADAQVNLREMRRGTDRARKIPRALAQEIARTQALAQQCWVEARQKSDFPLFAPWLEKMLDLRRQEADAVGYAESRYDALLDEYEPHATAREIEAVFAALRPPIVELVRQIAESGVQPRRELLTRSFPIDHQREFGLWVVRKMGFDFETGRVDVSAHPMTTGNLTDVRLTTRYDERWLAGALFGLIHEAGHGMYEQGFDPRHEGTPRATAASLGIHESQSRMWENLVGRSRAFWTYAFPFLQAFFPETTGDIALDDWYAAVNDVRPSLIRVEADEVTYNLHIVLRFEIERALIEGRVKVGDLPALWNNRMSEYLGITPANDAEGVLQDIHWSLGLIGYFPTYTLGNLYASQIFHAARQAVPDLPARFEAGDFLTLKHWLNANIHAPGQSFRAADLVRRVSGEAPDARFLVEHLRAKFGPLYGI